MESQRGPESSEIGDPIASAGRPKRGELREERAGDGDRDGAGGREQSGPIVLPRGHASCL